MLKRLPAPARTAVMQITNFCGIIFRIELNSGQEHLRARRRIWIRLVRFAQTGDYPAMGAITDRHNFRYDPIGLFSLALALLLVWEANGRSALGFSSYLPAAVVWAGLAFLLLLVQCFRRKFVSHLLSASDWPAHSCGQSSVVTLETEVCSL
jgi:hypothetical protein